jgi:hypothetical protein
MASWRWRSLEITYVRLGLGSDWRGVTLPHGGGVRLGTVIGDIHIEHVARPVTCEVHHVMDCELC